MSEKKFQDRRSSHSYQNRSDLPGQKGDFYDKAGAAKDAFTTAHDAQITERNAAPRSGAQDPGGEVWAAKSQKDRLSYSDPHPPYALPARKAPGEAPLLGTVTQGAKTELSEADFRAARQEPTQKRGRKRTLNRE